MAQRFFFLGFSVATFLVLCLVPAATHAGGGLYGIFSIDATAGSDVTGDGSIGNPFRTMSRAPSSWVTLRLRRGTYSAASGESFPMRIGHYQLIVADEPGVRIETLGAAAFELAGMDGSRCGRVEGLHIVGSTGGARSAQSAVAATRCGYAKSLVLRGNTIEGFAVGLDWRESGAGYGGGPINPVVGKISSNSFLDNEVGLWFRHSGRMTDRHETEVFSNVFDENETAVRLSTTGNIEGSLIWNNTFVHQTGDAIVLDYLNVASPPTIVGNIFAFNAGYGIRDEVAPAGEIDVNVFFMNGAGDWFDGASATAANPNVDPLLVDRLAADYHLAASSPAIDFARSADWLPVDRDVHARGSDGNGDGFNAPDAGAFELPATSSIDGCALFRGEIALDSPWRPFGALPVGPSNFRTPVILWSIRSGDVEPVPWNFYRTLHVYAAACPATVLYTKAFVRLAHDGDGSLRQEATVQVWPQ